MSGLDLLVLGELNPDVVVRCADDVRFGQVEQLVDWAEVTLGSSGAITAAAAAAQGLSVSFVGVVGDDALGALTVDLLAARGVDVSGVRRRADLATGMTVVLSRPDGDRALLTFPGAMSALRPDDVDQALVAQARHIHVSSVFLQRALQDGLPDLLRAAPGATSLDPGWDPAEDWDAARRVLPALDYFLPNEAECVRIAGVADPLAAARALQAHGPTVVVKQGATGAALAGPDGVLVVETTPVAPVDTTGAGDNFDAGFLAARLDGAALDASLARAAASGSISVRGWGGAGRLATRDEAVAAAASLSVRSVTVPEGARR